MGEGHRRQEMPHQEEEEVRVGPPRCDDQTGSPEDSHPQDQGWQQEVQGTQAGHWQLAWASEATARKTRIIDVVYNACNNELVRTKTLVKNAIVVIDAAPFRQWYESHYAQPLARKKGAKLTDAEEAVLNRKMSKKTGRKYAERQKTSEVEKPLLDQFQTGRVLAAISSRPGQCGRSDGYILEGKELEFYLRKIKRRANKCDLVL